MLSRRYEIFVRGVVPADLLEEMADAHREIEAQTVLRGRVRDQAELPELAAERRLYTRLLVADQTVAGAVLSRLEDAGFEVVRVAELRTSGMGTPHG